MTEQKLAEVIPLFPVPFEVPKVRCSFCATDVPLGQVIDNELEGFERRVICFKCVALATKKLKEN